MGQTLLLPTQQVACDLSIGIFTCDFGLFFTTSSRSWTFQLRLYLKWWQINQILLLPSNMKSHMGFELLYLDLILAYSECQLDCRNGVLPHLFTFFSLQAFCFSRFYFYCFQVQVVCATTAFVRLAHCYQHLYLVAPATTVWVKNATAVCLLT